MGFRGKSRFKKGNKKKQKGPQKQRKTYSLYGNNKGNNGDKIKRKSDNDFVKAKRQKLNEKQQVQQEEQSSESEEEPENHLKQLLEAFGSDTKKTIAIESSDDSDDNDDNEHDDNEDNETELLESTEEKGIKTVDANEENGVEIVEEDEVDVDTEKEDEQSDSAQDPFSKHLFYDLSNSLLDSLRSTPIAVDTYNEMWPELGKMVISIPKFDEAINAKKSTVTIAEDKPNAPKGTVPTPINPSKDKLSDLYIKSQIAGNIKEANKSLLNCQNTKLSFSHLQSEIFSVLNNYQDFYFTQRTFNNAEELRFIYCLHIVNHILKTRTKVLHHNARLNRKDDIPEEFRDQGLVRPKVILIDLFKVNN